MTECYSRQLKTLVVSSCAAIAFFSVLIAISADHWCMTQRKVFAGDRDIFQQVFLGVVNICHQQEDEGRLCIYRRTDILEHEPNYAEYTKRTLAFLLGSVLAMASGAGAFGLATFKEDNKRLMVCSCTCFVVSGILTMLSLLQYIYAVSSEIHPLTKELDENGQKIFLYNYGISFNLVLTSFFLQQLAGTITMHLCVGRFKRVPVQVPQAVERVDEEKVADRGENRRLLASDDEIHILVTEQELLI